MGFALAENKDKFMWEEDISEAIILEKKLEILNDFSMLKNKEIKEVDNCIGSYGMGGLGYFGFKYEDLDNLKWIVIDCDEKILYG